MTTNLYGSCTLEDAEKIYYDYMDSISIELPREFIRKPKPVELLLIQYAFERGTENEAKEGEL